MFTAHHEKKYLILNFSLINELQILDFLRIDFKMISCKPYLQYFALNSKKNKQKTTKIWDKKRPSSEKKMTYLFVPMVVDNQRKDTTKINFLIS